MARLAVSHGTIGFKLIVRISAVCLCRLGITFTVAATAVVVITLVITLVVSFAKSTTYHDTIRGQENMRERGESLERAS